MTPSWISRTLSVFLFISFLLVPAYSLLPPPAQALLRPGHTTKVLVVGGSGRVGGSTVRALRTIGREQGWNLTVGVGGRDESNLVKAKARWATLADAGSEDSYDDVGFLKVNLEDEPSLRSALQAFRPDLVIHTAGPFQRKEKPELLLAAMDLSIPYVDVCDDIKLATTAKALHSTAVTKGVPMLISTGVWPGISSLMAVDVSQALGGAEQTKTLDFNFFTAGSGNAGATILSATFLILSEKVLAFVDGAKAYFRPASDVKEVDFGTQIGRRQVFRMNLIEAFSAHEVLRVPNVSTFFGTSPDIWNLLLRFMALLPSSILRDRKLMQSLAVLSEPVVRLVDRLVGSTNAMRVDGVGYDGRRVRALYGHRDLEECVGQAVVAFAAQVLLGKVAPGIYYPEEAFGGQDVQARQGVYDIATNGCFLWQLPAPTTRVDDAGQGPKGSSNMSKEEGGVVSVGRAQENNDEL